MGPQGGAAGIFLVAMDDAPTFKGVVLPSEMGRHALLATLTLRGCVVNIANVHLDSNPARTDLRIEQLGWIEDAFHSASYSGSDRCLQIACGDFNFGPQGDEEKAVPAGWQDTWVTVNGPNASDGGTTHHGRIDRIFISSVKAVTVAQFSRLGVGVTVDNACIMPISDHCGIRVDLDF